MSIMLLYTPEINFKKKKEIKSLNKWRTIPHSQIGRLNIT